MSTLFEVSEGEQTMRRAASIFLACGIIALGFASSPASAHRSLTYDKQTVINVCKRACTAGHNRAVCCVCVGGEWSGKYCM